jgi:glutamate-ammonia-ligase adenylyltransferase
MASVRQLDLGEAIDRSAAPAAVAACLERLVATNDPAIDRLADDRALSRALVAVVAASRSLCRLVEARPADTLAVLADLDERPALHAVGADDLVAWKQLEFLRIAARDLTGRDPLDATGRALARLASDVFESACRLVDARDLAVIGMGKMGGAELNYASDVDIMFVVDGSRDEMEPKARAVMEIASRCFRVDANLRPEGRDGPLVRTIEAYEAYWGRWAEPWEFQALLKAQPAAGDGQLGARWLDTAERWLWNRPFSADDLRSLRAMKQRAEHQVERKGLTDREIKLGPGGIRDIEFTVQLLQLVHGHSDPDLRSPTTVTTIEELASAGYVDRRDADELLDAYRFFRVVEHRIQLDDEQQLHSLPTSPEALDRLARTVGYRDTTAADAAEQLMVEIRQKRVTVRAIHERIYFRPLLEAFTETTDGLTPGGLTPDAAVERLEAFGFTDAMRTKAAVKELTRGLNRSSRLMQQMLPLLLDWLSASPDPDLGLLVLRNLLDDRTRATQLIEAFRDSPEAARRLSLLVGTSRMLGEIVRQNPDLVARLPYSEQLVTLARDDLVASATEAVAWREADEVRAGLRRWKDRHLFGIAARDVLRAADVDVVGNDLTALAEATLEATLRTIDPQVPFAVIGMGRFGGGEMSYASDLDVLFVYDGEGMSAVDEANRVAKAINRFLGGSTPAERLYPIDADLRPEGKQGPMARSYEGFISYWNTYAQTWERQAMIRARTVAGDAALAERLLADLEDHVWAHGLTSDELLEIRRMKARVEGERIPPGEDPQFHLKLGRGSLSDVEFTAQMLQLQHGVRATGTVAALRALAATGVLAEEDADVLTESYRFCERVRNRWYLVNSGPSDSLPMQPEPLTWLARSIGITATELRDEYRRVTRRARHVVERVFYGRH